jgi:dTMP kinase
VEKRPLYVVFEGIDGAGKSVQIARLAARLERLGVVPVRLAEPTAGPIGREIRRRALEGPPLTPREELDLFLADRRENMQALVKPALERGAVVLQDRSFYSTLAYQCAREGGPSEDDVRAAHAFVERPDVVLLLDVPVERALERVRSRGRADAFEERRYLERVRARFLALRDPVVRVVDGRAAEDVVAEAVWGIVEPLLRERGQIERSGQ